MHVHRFRFPLKNWSNCDAEPLKDTRCSTSCVRVRLARIAPLSATTCSGIQVFVYPISCQKRHLQQLFEYNTHPRTCNQCTLIATIATACPATTRLRTGRQEHCGGPGTRCRHRQTAPPVLGRGGVCRAGQHLFLLTHQQPCNKVRVFIHNISSRPFALFCSHLRISARITPRPL